MTISLARKTQIIKHPFAEKEPKPTRARLISLLDPLGRRRYGEVERFLSAVKGATSGLFYFNTTWGWAVRYVVDMKTTICVLHLLPNQFEATVMLGKEMDVPLKSAAVSSDLKRRINRSKVVNGDKAVRLPIKNDADFGCFQMLIKLKSEAMRSKNGKALSERSIVEAPKSASTKSASK